MRYFLGNACQNTFVLFDCLDRFLLDGRFCEEAHRILKEEGKDDALILIDGSCMGDSFHARMLVLGLDGTFGEFCGNGARVCAAYLFASHPHIKQCFLRTRMGDLRMTQQEEGIYSVKLPCASFEMNQKFVAQELPGFQYMEILEPHLLVEGKMSDEELLSIGRALNARRDLFPLGINVNAWHVEKKDLLYVKTYERGVQRLTQACGTGSASCAAFYKKEGTVRVKTAGGVLEIDLQGDGIELKGPAFFFDSGKKVTAG